MILKDFITPEIPKQPECKGLVFRGINTTWYSNGRLENKQGIRLLKKKSCPGCLMCGWILEDMDMRPHHVILPEIISGALYTVVSINETRDWETGYVDDWDLLVKPLEGEPE